MIGLPFAPSASARNVSGIITPSNRSGALPTTTASMSFQVSPASSSARRAASRTSPAIDTSNRLLLYAVCPTPMTAQGLAILLSRQHADEVLLEARPGRRVGEQIGRASCRERVWVSGGDGAVEEK